MHNDSQKQRQLALKAAKGRLQHLPIETIEKISRLPDRFLFEKVAINPAIPDEPPKEFVLRFTYLKENICCYEQIDETKTKALFRKLKQITELTSKTLPASNLIRDSILNKPPYTSLFTGLPPDADVKETELPNAGRIFFWLLQEKFFVISIETKHRDIYG